MREHCATQLVRALYQTKIDEPNNRNIYRDIHSEFFLRATKQYLSRFRLLKCCKVFKVLTRCQVIKDTSPQISEN